MIDTVKILEQYFPLDKEEVPIASGCYHYYCNKQLMTIMEPWLITRRHQHRIYRSMREASAFQTQIYVKSERSYSSSSTQIIYKQAGFKKDVTYLVDKERLLMRDMLDDSELSMRLTPDSVFFPLLRIFTGDVLQAARNDSAEVIVPLIAEGTSPKQILSPTISKRRSQFIRNETLAINNQVHMAQKWSYRGDRYGDGTYFWLDDSGVLLSYVWPRTADETWKIQLSQYEKVDQVRATLSTA